MNNEPSYFGLTNDHTWLSVDEDYYKKLKPTHRMKCYTHPAKTLKNQRMIEVLEELSKYRLLSTAEINELVILRKAQEK